MATIVPLHHRIEQVRFYSDILEVEKAYYIWLPEGYSPTDHRYPAIYFLRGHEVEWINPSEAGRGGRSVCNVIEELEEAGMPPALYIFPNVASDDGLTNGAATNLLRPDLGSTTGVGTGRFEDYLIREVIPDVERRFAAGPNRGVEGFSMGGFMAVKLALRHPGLFQTVGAYEGAFVYLDGWRTLRRRDQFLGYPIFTPAFGIPRDRHYFRQHNPANLVQSAEAANVQAVRWLIHCGDPAFESEVNYQRTQHLLALLQAKGGTNLFGDGVIPGAHHSWRWADEHVRLSLPLHLRYLSSAPE